MLRGFVALLLLANLVFMAWARGWFAPGWPPPRQGEREPERVIAQVRPTAVTVLPPKAASAAVSAARAAGAACMEAGPFVDAEIGAAEAALAAAQPPDGAWTREAVPPPPLWLVYLPRGADAEQRRNREDGLRKLGLVFEPIEAAGELAAGLVLSRHASKADADTALAALPGGAPLRGARVVSLPEPPTRHALRFAVADTELQARLQALPAAALAGGFRRCAAGAKS